MKPIDKIKEFIFNLNEKGVPLPLLRDPNTDSPSVTMTMMVIAFSIAAAGLLGKLTKVLGDVDVSAANYLFLTSAGLYLGRKMTGTATNTEVSNKEEETK
tara:strand:- start:2137 stop:2436 length:300 start_codon:yes stop_codon:yes gene_type:complete